MAKKKLYAITRNNTRVVYNLEGQIHARKTLERITQNLAANKRYAVSNVKADERTLHHIPTNTTDVYAIVPN